MTASLVARAKDFAIQAHGDQMYAKYPYEHHLQGVADLVQKRNKSHSLLHIMLAVAWLHDCMEDCGVEWQELSDLFGNTIANAVWRLTKEDCPEGVDKETHYMEYLNNCKGMAVSLEVKKCDTMFNLYTSFKGNRVKGIKKYSRQLSILEEGNE